MKSVWETFSKMTPEERSKYLNFAKNKRKKTQTGTKSAKYTRVQIIPPPGGLQWGGGPGWDDE